MSASNPLAIKVSPGTLFEGRFRIETMSIGKHSTVFKVEDVLDRHQKYSLKAEYDRGTKLNYLHQEIAVLQKLASRQHVARLYYCERCDPFSFMLTTLFGKSIWSLRQLVPNKMLSAGSVARIGVHTLYQLKQLHEVGYILRDLKVGDMLVGLNGKDVKVVYLVDFGMCRTYVVKGPNEKLSIRPPREKAFIRGILRYCSPNVHERKDVGRSDDIWSLAYVLVDLVTGLPWREHKVEEPVAALKKRISDEDLMRGCPAEWIDILKHVRTLKYGTRPNYKLIFDRLRASLIRLNVTYSDPWDWELIGNNIVVETLPPEERSREEKSREEKSKEEKSRDEDKEESTSSSSEKHSADESTDRAPPPKKMAGSPRKDDAFGKLVTALRKSTTSSGFRVPISLTNEKTSERRVPASEYDPQFPTTNPAEFEKNDIGL